MPRRASSKRSGSARSKRVSFSRRIKGKGAYTLENGPWAKRGASAGAIIGGKFGGPIGSFLGEKLGRRLFHYPAKLFGSGDYTTENMPLVSSGSDNRISPPVPKFTMDKDGVTICHTEYLGDIITSATAGNLKIQKFAINPANMQTFPWLSSIACQSFQQYKFSGMAFQFKSYSANALNSTNTALGALFSCINYDYTDDDFTTRSQIENSSWAQACKPSDDVLIPVECKPQNTSLNGFLYVQNGIGIPSDGDPRLYNLGKLFIGTTGFQGTSVNIGSLYVTYKIHLFKPIIPAPLVCANYVNQIRTATGGANPFGLGYNITTYSADTIGCSFNSTGTTLTMLRDHLPAGARLLIAFIWYGTPAVITHPSIAVTGLAAASAFDTWTSTAVYTPDNGATSGRSQILLEYVVDGSNDPMTITLNALGTYPTAGYMEVYITQRNGEDSQNLGIYTGI